MTWPAGSPTTPEFWRKHLGDRIQVWAPFNMPWTVYESRIRHGVFPPGRASYTEFLKAAHTINLAQGEAFRSIKAASFQSNRGQRLRYGPGLSQDR